MSLVRTLSLDGVGGARKPDCNDLREECQSGPTPMSRTIVARMTLALAGSLALAVGLYYGAVGQSWLLALQRWNAAWASRLLDLLGASTSADGVVVYSPGFAVSIVAECTAIGPMVLFAGAVLACPASLKARAGGVLLGVVVLTLVNLVRIATLFWIGSTFPRYLSVAHLLVWQTAIVVVAIGLWLWWTERVGIAWHR